MNAPFAKKAYTIHEAKTHLSRLIKAALAGEEVIITRGKEPVAKLVPLETELPPRKPGAWKGKVVIHEGAFDPLSDEELDAWYNSKIFPE